MLAAIRRASSFVNRFIGTPAGLVLVVDVGKRLPVGVNDREALWVLFDPPGRREAAAVRLLGGSIEPYKR
jgi:hypothetical protein